MNWDIFDMVEIGKKKKTMILQRIEILVMKLATFKNVTVLVSWKLSKKGLGFKQ